MSRARDGVNRASHLETIIVCARAELSALSNGTWGALLLYQRHDGITPAELAEVLGLMATTANERLRKLWRADLVTREVERVEGGGRTYRYKLRDRQ